MIDFKFTEVKPKKLSKKELRAWWEQTKKDGISPEMKAHIKECEQYQQVLQDGIDQSEREREKKESRILNDIAKELLSDKPKKFKVYGWQKIREEYGAKLSGPCGRWGQHDMIYSVSSAAQSYNWDTIVMGIEAMFESQPNHGPTVEPKSLKPAKILPFPLIANESVENLASRYNAERVDKMVKELKDYLKAQKARQKGKDDETTD